MPTGRELLALEETFDRLTPKEKHSVVRAQARVRGWAQRNKTKTQMIRDAANKGGVWGQFSLNVNEVLVETYRAHAGGPVASGTGDFYVTDKRVCFYCDAIDPKYRDGYLFSPSKPKKETKPPIALKIAYKEIKAITTKAEYVSEPGVVLEMRDGSSMWFGGFYFTSSVKAVIENEWTRETVAKLNHAQALRTQILMSQSRGSSAAHDRAEALKEALEIERAKVDRANAREREHALEIEILRENEERLERQKKKLMNQARDLEEDIETARLKQTAALTAQHAAEKKLFEMERTFESKIDAVLEEKNMTIEEMSREVNSFKLMLNEERSAMRAEVERARKQTSEMRDQRDVLVSEKAKLSIKLSQVEAEFASRPDVDDSRAEERVAELEAALEAFNAEKRSRAASMAALSAKHDKAMAEISNLRAELAARDEAVYAAQIDHANVAELEAALEAMRVECKSSAATVADVHAKHNKAMIEITNLRTELSARDESARATPVDNSRVAELEAALEAMRVESKSSAATVADVRAKHDIAMSEITNLRTENERIRADQSLANSSELQSLRVKYEAAVNALTVARNEKDEAIMKSKVLAQREGELNKQLSGKSTKIKAMEVEMNALRDTRESAGAAMAALSVKHDEAQKQLCALHSEKAELTKSSSAELQHREDKLRQELGASKAKSDELLHEIDALRLQREESRVSMATLESKYQEAAGNLQELKTRHAAELQHHEGKLRQELGASKAKVDELLHEIDALRLQREENRVSMATLESRYQEAAGNLQELKTRYAADLAKFENERKALECALTESKESSVAALAVVQNDREAMRHAKEQQNVSMVELKAKFDSVGKQLESTKADLANAISAREKAIEDVHLAKQSEEKAKSQMLAHEKSLFQVEADISAAQIKAATALSAAKTAEEREHAAKTELQELRRQNQSLIKEHGSLEARSTQLEEKAQMLIKVEQEMAALRAELQITAVQQEKWKQDVAYAKAEIERSRNKAEVDSEKFSAMLKNMSAAEREAASARAAESVARDYASRSNETAKEIQARELRMREELTTMRVAYEKLTSDFRAKTEEFSREVSRLEKAVGDEQNKLAIVQLKLEEAEKRCSTLEQANIHSHNKISTYKDTLQRQKQEMNQLYTEYQNVCSNLDETKMMLEREQTATRDMHMQKMMEKQRASAQGLRGTSLPNVVVPTRSPLANANSNSRLQLPPIEQLLPALGPTKSGMMSPTLPTVD